MLQENNTWSVDVYYAPFNPPSFPTWTETEQISIGTIEEINGLDYYRLKSGDQDTCLLREENGIVFKYDENEGIDKILFDFTLEEGDTFNLTASAYDTYYDFCTTIGGQIWEDELIVDTVEEIEIAGMLRKVITFLEYNNYVQFQWIEGIGNISGFDNLWEQLDITDGTLLVCFSTNGTSYFFNGANSCDNTTLGLDEVYENNSILYPNPVFDKSILQFPSEEFVDIIRIFDIQGRLVKEETITTDHVIIDAMQYRSGMYFYQVFSNDELIRSDKFIVK